MEKQRWYIAIDLKSFYASVECFARGLDPLTTNLVVADESRTDKTICLAVSPSLKAYGIPGRARLFEVKAKLEKIKQRTGKEIEFIIAPPRMAEYIKETQEYIHPLMEKARDEYPEYSNQLFLIRYHMNSVIEALRHHMRSSLG